MASVDTLVSPLNTVESLVMAAFPDRAGLSGFPSVYTWQGPLTLIGVWPQGSRVRVRIEANPLGGAKLMPGEAVVPAPNDPVAPWETGFQYDPNWSGTLRYRYIGQNLLLFEGTAAPLVAPVPNTPVLLGSMPQAYWPGRVVRLTASLEQTKGANNYLLAAGLGFQTDGTVNIVYSSANGAAFCVCGIIPL